MTISEERHHQKIKDKDLNNGINPNLTVTISGERHHQKIKDKDLNNGIDLNLTVHHMSKCIIYNKAIVGITKKTNCFLDYIYMNRLILLLQN